MVIANVGKIIVCAEKAVNESEKVEIKRYYVCERTVNYCDMSFKILYLNF